VGSLLAGALLHTAGWATLNLVMLPLIAVTLSVTWRWRQGGDLVPRRVPAEAARSVTSSLPPPGFTDQRRR
jgi:hypothetical protein